MIRLKYASTEDDIAQVYAMTKNVRDINTFLGGGIVPPRAKAAAEKRGLLLAKSEARVVGFMLFNRRKDGWTTLYDIAVLPDFRRQGIAGMLLRCLSTPIRVTVMESNDGMRSFVRNNGFRLVSRNGRKTSQGIKYTLVYEKAN